MSSYISHSRDLLFKQYSTQPNPRVDSTNLCVSRHSPFADSSTILVDLNPRSAHLWYKSSTPMAMGRSTVASRARCWWPTRAERCGRLERSPAVTGVRLSALSQHLIRFEDLVEQCTGRVRQRVYTSCARNETDEIRPNASARFRKLIVGADPVSAQFWCHR